MTWAIWRQRGTMDPETSIMHGHGEWCVERSDDDDIEMWEIKLFETEAEARRVAGVWNSTSETWNYHARRIT